MTPLEKQAVEEIKGAILAEVASMPPKRRMDDMAGCVAEAADKVRAEIVTRLAPAPNNRP